MSGQNRSHASKANFDLVLQGPFVVCEAADNTSLLISAPDPKGKMTEHEDAALLTDFLDYRFTKEVQDYELTGDLHSGNMTIVNPQKIKRVEFKGPCPPSTRYHWSLKVPKPDEIYLTWPQSIRVGPSGQCKDAIPEVYSTRFVLRYRGVDVSKGFQVSHGTDTTKLQVMQIGSEGTMVFEMPPIGEHPDHDKEAYDAMAEIAGVKSCIYVPANRNNENGHTDCHAPLIYLYNGKVNH